MEFLGEFLKLEKWWRCGRRRMTILEEKGSLELS